MSRGLFVIDSECVLWQPAELLCVCKDLYYARKNKLSIIITTVVLIGVYISTTIAISSDIIIMIPLA